MPGIWIWPPCVCPATNSASGSKPSLRHAHTGASTNSRQSFLQACLPEAADGETIATVRIDAHQHFWRYDATDYSWINVRMQRIARDFLPADLQPRLEACNLDGTIAVVTNIDPEHLDHYGDFDGVKDAFVEFIHNVPFYGAAILCIDHEEVQAVIGKVRDRNVVTYGFNLQADICGVNVRPDAGGNVFDVIVRRRGKEDRRIEGVRLPMPGRHNVQNALAAIAVSIEMGCPDEIICNGFSAFGGVRRRFTKVGEVPSGGGVATIIDDYGHHPGEIRAVLGAARISTG